MTVKKLMISASFLAVSVVALAGPANSASTLKHFTKAQQKELDAYMKTYLMEHPQVITASVQKMQMDQRIKQMAASRNQAIKLANQLVSDKYSPAINQGKVTLVEFFDYQCSVCHMMYPEVDKLMKAHPNLRIVFKEFPIFGPASEYASKASIAARLQGQQKFLAYHNALFKSGLMEGKLKDADVDRLAKKAGLDMAKLKRDMNSPAVINELKETNQLAQSLKLTGTPAFMIMPTNTANTVMMKNMTFIPGGAQYEQLNQAVQKIQQ